MGRDSQHKLQLSNAVLRGLGGARLGMLFGGWDVFAGRETRPLRTFGKWFLACGTGDPSPTDSWDVGCFLRAAGCRPYDTKQCFTVTGTYRNEIRGGLRVIERGQTVGSVRHRKRDVAKPENGRDALACPPLSNDDALLWRTADGRPYTHSDCKRSAVRMLLLRRTAGYAALRI